MLRFLTILAPMVSLAFCGSSALAQNNLADPEKARLASEAEAILLTEEGTWKSVWETLNAEGEVVKTFHTPAGSRQ